MKQRKNAQARQTHNSAKQTTKTDNEALVVILSQKGVLSTMQRRKTKLKSSQMNQMGAMNIILTL